MIHAEHENVTRPVWTREATKKAVVLTVFMYALLALSVWMFRDMAAYEPFRLRYAVRLASAALFIPLMSAWSASPARRPFEDHVGFFACLAITMIGSIGMNTVTFGFLIAAALLAYIVAMVQTYSESGDRHDGDGRRRR